MTDEFQNVNISVFKQLMRDKFSLIAFIVLFIIYFSPLSIRLALLLVTILMMYTAFS